MTSRAGVMTQISTFSGGSSGTYATPPRLPSGGTEWGCVLMLGLVCSAFGFTFQPVAQSHMDSQRAGLMCALNPAFASILGVLILHESMNIEGVLGAALILSSLFIPHFFSTQQTANRQHR